MNAPHNNQKLNLFWFRRDLGHKPNLEKLANYPELIVTYQMQVKLAKIMFMDAKKENDNASVK